MDTINMVAARVAPHIASLSAVNTRRPGKAGRVVQFDMRDGTTQQIQMLPADIKRADLAPLSADDKNTLAYWLAPRFFN